MNWKTYKNELIVAGALLLMLIGLIYKQVHISDQLTTEDAVEMKLYELKEVIALKKVWANKKISKKVEKLQTLVAPSKIKWQKKSKKVTVSFSSLSAIEVNKVITKILNLAVQIQKLDIKKLGSSYSVELKCKW